MAGRLPRAHSIEKKGVDASQSVSQRWMGYWGRGGGDSEHSTCWVEYFLPLCSKCKEIKKRESKKRRGSVLLCIHSFWRVLHYIKKTLKAEENFYFLPLPPFATLQIFIEIQQPSREKVFHRSSRPCCCVQPTRSFPYCQWMEMVEGVTYVTSYNTTGDMVGGSPPHLISLAPVAASSSLPSKS